MPQNSKEKLTYKSFQQTILNNMLKTYVKLLVSKKLNAFQLLFHHRDLIFEHALFV